jgi:CheY-like chemotaxis protein
MRESKKILVVDDNPFIIVTARAIFEDAGFEVFAANSGKECVSFLENEQFKGVILMDLMMPEMDGWETIDKIVEKGLDRNVIISVLSAKEVPIENPKEMKYIADYFNKPLDAEKIIKKINSYFVYE